MRTFADGNYVLAREQFDAVRSDDRITEAGRDIADQLYNATKIDLSTLYTGLACILVFGVAIALTAFIQP